ncbi:hypothetical protein [uncultured Clostridium sp.]|uniref:hypothetical protein n=1 Tax=uncultured Clostridium sp. TaxID=59620 RepID=UPI0028E5235B|nr:hypothetical protein [uncultured Clostridium sp.]
MDNKQAMQELKSMIKSKESYTTKVFGEAYKDEICALNIAIEALERRLPKEVETEEMQTIADSSGDIDIEYNMLCPTCRSIVGVENENEGLFFDHCPDCGQRLKYTVS